MAISILFSVLLSELLTKRINVMGMALICVHVMLLVLIFFIVGNGK